MVNENQTWFIDFSEKGPMWHIDLERVPENDSWVNIGYGRYEVLSYFCDMVDVLTSEFKCKKQVFDQQFSEKLDSADFGKLVLHIVIDKAVMRQRAAASLLGA